MLMSPFEHMLTHVTFCLLSPVLMYCHHSHSCCHHHCSESNWLEKKRQTVLEQRRLDNELKLEKLRLATQQKQIERESKNAQRREKSEDLRREKEKARREEQILMRLENIERLIRSEDGGVQSSAIPPTEAKEMQPSSVAPLVSEEKSQKSRLLIKNRQTALHLFRAKLKGSWAARDNKMRLFHNKELCEEYLEYESSLPSYCLQFLADLPQGEAVSLKVGQTMKYNSDNGEDLLPSVEELSHRSENASMISHFEDAREGLRFLEENAQQMGVVEVVAMSGQTYWVTYRDLLSSFRKEESSSQ